MEISTKLALRFLKKNKKRTIATIVGITIVTALIMGILLLFQAYQDYMIELIRKEENWEARFNNIPYEKVYGLTKHTVKKNVEILLELKNQTIEVKGKENIYFMGDFKWTVEAITNIVKNAIEYSKEEDIIQIAYEKNALYTEIAIQDKGKGMNEDELSHIFDRFYKGTNSNRDNFGIGLSLAKQIVSEQNGEIKVESKINKGTKFVIRFIN